MPHEGAYVCMGHACRCADEIDFDRRLLYFIDRRLPYGSLAAPPQAAAADEGGGVDRSAADQCDVNRCCITSVFCVLCVCVCVRVCVCVVVVVVWLCLIRSTLRRAGVGGVVE